MSNGAPPIGEELTLLAAIIGMALVRSFDRRTAGMIAQFINNIGGTMITVLVQDTILFPTPATTAPSATVFEEAEEHGV